jgi:hypothetical protein
MPLESAVTKLQGYGPSHAAGPADLNSLYQFCTSNDLRRASACSRISACPFPCFYPVMAVANLLILRIYPAGSPVSPGPRAFVHFISKPCCFPVLLPSTNPTSFIHRMPASPEKPPQFCEPLTLRQKGSRQNPYWRSFKSWACYSPMSSSVPSTTAPPTLRLALTLKPKFPAPSRVFADRSSLSAFYFSPPICSLTRQNSTRPICLARYFLSPPAPFSRHPTLPAPTFRPSAQP